jgi:cyanophycinase
VGERHRDQEELVTGTLALVGGGEWSEACTFDAELLKAAGADEVAVLPTGFAFENPAKHIARARAWFEGLGATVRDVHVIQRSDANDAENADAVRRARVIYLAGDSPMHVRSVLKETVVWDALAAAWQGGATVAGSGGAACALLDPMFDPRGGAFTVGLGLLENIAVLPDAEDDVAEHHRRTLGLAQKGLLLATIQRGTALIRDDSGWRTSGAGRVRVFVGGEERGLDALPLT